VDGTLTLRRYEPADADDVWALHERALRASNLEFLEDAPAGTDLAEIAGRYLGTGGEFLVGLVDGDVVAMGGFQLENGTVKIRRMRVHPDHQRRGYGTRLLAELERRASEAGVALETNVRLTAARRLYESQGDTQTGRETRRSTGDEFVRYSKPLFREDSRTTPKTSGGARAGR
jgi:GNAT superfamily N-acetyltransferase